MLKEEKICQYFGEVSLPYCEAKSLLTTNSSPDGTVTWLGCNTLNIGGVTFFLGLIPYHTKPWPFTSLALFIEVKDIKGRYILVRGGADNAQCKEIQYQTFYSTYPDLGTSSLRKDIITERTDDAAPIIKEEMLVPSFSLEYLLDHFDWEKYKVIECLKTDAEGKDFDIIESCGKYLSKIAFIRAEAFDHDDPQLCDYGLADQLVSFLEENGFELFDRAPGDFKFKNKSLTEIIQKEQLGWK